ncbi:MAG: hypothetical protein Q9163_003181 [Psora crenata]
MHSAQFPNWIQHKNGPETQLNDRRKDGKDQGHQRSLDGLEKASSTARTTESIRSRQRHSKRRRTPTDDEYDRGVQPIGADDGASSLSSSFASLSQEPQKDDSPYGTVRHELHNASGLDYIEAQRHRLLGISDWVGINPTEPCRIAFAAVEDRDQIGKRRQLSQVPYHIQHCRTDKRLKRTGYFERIERSPRPSQDHLSQAGVSVRIGAAGERSTRGDPSTGVSSAQAQDTAAIKMLLDDGVAELDYNSPEFGHRPKLVTEGIDPPPRQERRVLAPSPLMRNPPMLSSQESLDVVTDQEGHVPLASIQKLSHGTSLPENNNNGHYMDEARRFSFGRDLTPPAATEWVKERSSSPFILESALEQHAHDGQPLEERKHASRTSPPPNMASSDTEMLQAYTDQRGGVVAKEQRRSTGLDEFSLTRGNLEMLRSAHGKGYMTRNSELLLSPGYHGAVLGKPEAAVDEEDAMWNAFVKLENSEEIRRPTMGHSTIVRLKPAPERKYTPIREERRNLQSAHQRAQAEKVKDEELVWRNFVFGNNHMKEEWMIEKPNETRKCNKTSTTHPLRTQQLMLAEVATSPIMQGPHLADEAADADSSPVSGVDEVSVIAKANSDLIPLEGMLYNSLPEPPSDVLSCFNPNVHGQAIDEQCHAPRNLPCSFSVEAQASTSSTNSPVQPSNNAAAMQTSMQAIPSSVTDPLAWCAARVFPQRTQTPGPQQHGRRRPAVMFKKPVRYIGEQSSDPVEPVTLGRRNSSRRFKSLTEYGALGGNTTELGYDDDIEDD